MSIIILLSPSHFFLLRITIYKSENYFISNGDNNNIPFLKKKKKTNKSVNKPFQDRHQMNFWLVRNMQKYYISIIPYLSSNKKLYHMLHSER